MAKLALLIGVSEYEPGLNPLPTAVHDVVAMQAVLANPEMGDFAISDITVLSNPDRQTMEDAIYSLFANCQKDDLVLLYFSGHGVVDDSYEFYFSTRFTRKEVGNGRLVPTTAVAARSVQGWMEQSRSQYQVIILDSCFSGAFAKGVKAKDSGSVNLEQFLGGKGRAILTASTSTQYALTQEGFDLSVYTHYLVEGIRTGGADLDDDGFIAVEELHTYASAKMREAAPAMTPEFYPVKEGYKIRLAKSPKDDPQLQYRKRVIQIAEEDEGNFSFINRSYLDDLRRSLGLSADVTIAIETEELEPYRQRQAKVDRYHTVFLAAITQRYPLTARDRTALKRLQEPLSLRDQDIALIEAPILASRPRLPQASKQPAPAPTPQSSPTITRQQFLKWTAFGGGGVVLALIGNQIFQSQKTPKTPEPPQLLTSNFETVTVDNRGQVIKRTPGKTTLFKQDLGNGVTLELVKIPAGEFLMGTAASERDTLIRELTRYGVSQKDAEKWVGQEMPQHRVQLPEFWMGKFAVTQEQWQQVAGLSKIKRDLDPDPANFKGAKRPVEQVSWEEAVEFCDRLSRKTNQSYRLPSEAEWEYAGRAGTATPFYFGATITSALVNCDGSNPYGDAPKGEYRKQTTEVGSFPPNGFGLYDMHGNVWEWCRDDWHDSYTGKPENLKQNGSLIWSSSDVTRKSVRGGSWIYNPWYCRSACRNYASPVNRHYIFVGFRVVCRAPRTL